MELSQREKIILVTALNVLWHDVMHATGLHFAISRLLAQYHERPITPGDIDSLIDKIKGDYDTA